MHGNLSKLTLYFIVGWRIGNKPIDGLRIVNIIKEVSRTGGR